MLATEDCSYRVGNFRDCRQNYNELGEGYLVASHKNIPKYGTQCHIEQLFQ